MSSVLASSLPFGGTDMSLSGPNHLLPCILLQVIVAA